MCVELHVSIDKQSSRHNTFWRPLWSVWSKCTSHCGTTTRTLRCFASTGGFISKCTRMMNCSEQCGGK